MFTGIRSSAAGKAKTSTRTILNSAIIGSLLLASWATQRAHATVIVVRYVVPGGLTSGICDTWGNACDLPSALFIAGSGDQVWVKQGVYKPTSNPLQPGASFLIPADVGVYGGFAGTETSLAARNWITNLTILSGDIDNNDAQAGTTNIDITTADISGSNSYHVVRVDGSTVVVTSSTVLDGFTITGGDATGASNDANGGGLFCYAELSGTCSPNLQNLTFSGNFANGNGGAIYDDGAGGTSNPTLRDVNFTGNKAGSGGAMTNNGSGGTSSPSLRHVTFSNNQAVGVAGAMYNDGAAPSSSSSPTLENVSFSGNSSLGAEGGAIYNGADPFGVSSPSLTNVTFNGNTSFLSGGAMFSDGLDGTSTPTVRNSIFWGDLDGTGEDEIFDLAATSSVNYTDLWGGFTGTGNISSDPLLAPLGNNGGTIPTMALTWGSPAIDSGLDGVCPFDDARGVLRWQGAHCDMGAYERIPPTVRADFTGARMTDVGVFRPSTGGWFVKSVFGTSFGLSGDDPLPFDFNGNGIDDVAVFRPSDASWYVQGQFSTFYGVAGDVPVPGDYNGDGPADLAIYRPSSSAWFVKNQFATVFGLPGDIPVPGDYNGDGKIDIAVFRPSTGAWFVRGQFSAIFGLPGDIPVPGDYNGDGITDLAVFRPSTNGWFVKNVTSTIYGVAGDIPVPGDYDGNGTTDIAVYRPSTSGWFVKSQFSTVYGLVGDYPLPAPDTNGDGDPYQ